MTELYKKLQAHREALRNKENKHTPTAIISDDALKALASIKPTQLSDMLKIKGIGSSFVEKYGQGFLDILLEGQKPVKLTMMKKEVIDTLKNLQSRLTNLNRRNRMLYLVKSSSRAIDLCTGDVKTDGKTVDFLFNQKPLVVSTIKDNSYTAYNRLLRNADAAAREEGGNSLYIGYPFVIGSCGDGKNAFNVSAPLALFPVSAENVDGDITIKADEARDCVYNSAFILLHNKFNSVLNALPECVIDSVSKSSFLKDLTNFYLESNIKLKPQDGSDALSKLGGYTDKNFPVFAPNEYRITPCAAIGMFPSNSGAMQKDFDDIIDSGLMPYALTELLEGADEIEDMYSDSVEIDDTGAIGSESVINNITELNVSQEKAIEKTTTQRTLVMQGPPGTGKSQTITSMITNAVDGGKNVLVVSQKQAALSVIYSRLGRLSKYALFVDDPKDKNAFYSRLKNMFDAKDSPAPFNSVAYNRAVAEVDRDITSLDDLGKALLSDDYGAPMIDIYGENFDNKFIKAERTVTNLDPQTYRDLIPDALISCGYENIKSAFNAFNDKDLTTKLDSYYELNSKYAWIVDFKKELSASQISSLLSELDGIIDLYAQKKRLKFSSALKKFCKANFAVYNRKFFKRFKKSPVEFYNGVKSYEEYYDLKLTADALDYSARLYYGALNEVAAAQNKSTYELNAELFDYLAYAIIDKFENANRAAINAVSNFSTIVGRICQNIDRKRALTVDKTLNTLKTTFNANIAESKRKGDMLRAIDGKRRPAISKFVNKFEFELFRGVKIFLMTPEAVSELLPLKNDLFDLLVFDEASQIYVERGIPAIARARRLVVCGDHKQLRPSSLGDGRITVDDDELDNGVLEEESLLDIARFKFKEVMLSYHYRSRYEELIAFSNAAFYGGKLNISPNPTPPPKPPIEIHKVNGVWDDRVNKAEANEVIKLISDYLLLTADKKDAETLGVITFNAKQRDYILDLIDKKCDDDKTFKSLYYDAVNREKDGENLGLFVKNIENVQGDERDRIIFSFAYARNSNGVMNRNFGWLNQAGGENRLNVAISRAKRHIDIVTSIIPIDLKVDDIATPGVIILRKYLDYAYCVSNGDKIGAQKILNSFKTFDVVTTERNDRLGDAVFDRLKNAGLNVERGVGMGNYKLDLAVKNDKGEYLLGIECDDSLLGKGDEARERDVMRNKFLRSRGWKIARVWSADYYRDPDKVIDGLLSMTK